MNRQGARALLGIASLLLLSLGAVWWLALPDDHAAGTAVHTPLRMPETDLLRAIRVAESNLKIFIYDNPAPYMHAESGICTDENYFSMERHLVSYLNASLTRTDDPDAADLFVITHSIVCAAYDRFVINETGTLDQFEQEFVAPVWTQFTRSKYFIRNGGRDHVFPYFTDNGVFCDEGMRNTLPGPLRPPFSKYLEHVIVVGYFGMTGLSPFVRLISNYSINGCFRVDQDIVIPQHHTFDDACYSASSHTHAPRDVLTFFEGAVREDVICSPGSRIALAHIAPRHTIDGELPFNKGTDPRNAAIAFAPSGAACWSTRLFHALCSGSVPLIIARHVVEPFERFLDWTSFSMKLDVENIYDDALLFRTLRRHFGQSYNKWVARSNRAKAMQRNVAKVRTWFGWSHSASTSSWKLILLELFCRTAKGREEHVCLRSSSAIARTTYLLDEEQFFSRDSALGDIPPRPVP